LELWLLWQHPAKGIEAREQRRAQSVQRIVG
jgi:hypothetical protein